MKISMTQPRDGVWAERIFIGACWAAVAIPLVLLAIFLIDVAADGIGRIDLEFIQNPPSARPSRAGLWPALVGSVYLMILTALMALPLGVGAAIYLEEYGRRSRLSGIIEVTIANLAGVPSVIYGLLGLGLFVRGIGMGTTLISGAATLALLILPIVIMASREALRTVPHPLREAALGLGATRWQMIRQVVLPMCIPGILTGAILSLSRAIGETAPLIVVGAVTYMSFTPTLTSGFTVLPVQIYDWVGQSKPAFQYNAAAGIVVLMATLLVINSGAIFLRNHYQKRNT